MKEILGRQKKQKGTTLQEIEELEAHTQQARRLEELKQEMLMEAVRKRTRRTTRRRRIL